MSFQNRAQASVGRMIARFPGSIQIRNQDGTDDETVDCTAAIPFRNSMLVEPSGSGDLEVRVLQSSLTFEPKVGYWAVYLSETYRVEEVEKFADVSYRLRLGGGS